MCWALKIGTRLALKQKANILGYLFGQSSIFKPQINGLG